jgi:hypothetical protein
MAILVMIVQHGTCYKDAPFTFRNSDKEYTAVLAQPHASA